MVRKSIFGLIGISAIVAVCIALWKAWGVGVRAFRGGSDGEWDSAPFTTTPVSPLPAGAAAAAPVAPVATATATAEPWIEADEGACPASHPIKGKLSSGIYHSPGGMNYARTKADRCYLDGAAAERDGLRAAKL